MNTEERQLAEVLHRVIPEPPRRVTVEDIAFRLANEPGYREPRPRRGLAGGSRGGRGRGWMPVLAAASVVVVAGASAVIATALSAHHSRAVSAQDGKPSVSASLSGSASPTASPQSGTWLRIADGIWRAELINRQSLGQDLLTGSGNSLYAVGGGSLVRIDSATGRVLQRTAYSPPVLSRPVVLGNTVWAVWSYSGGDIVLRGYDARTLAQVASVEVPAIGGVASTAQGVLAAGPDGKLYVAAGDTVAIVDPAAGRITDRIYLPAGQSSSVAVSPDGSKLYVGTGTFRLITYDLRIGIIAASSRMSVGGAGNLVVTSGGVWGTARTGTSEWVWFAPNGDLSQVIRVSQGAGAGLDPVPSYSGGAVWIGGSQRLACANPATGQVMASTAIPADHGVAGYFDGVTLLSSGHAYALYQDQAAHLAGVASLTPPAACLG